MNKTSVLIVDDSRYARYRLRRFLEAQGRFEVAEADDGEQALAGFDRLRPSLVLIDQIMRGREGIETARLLLERDPGVKIIMLTAVDEPGFKQHALDQGILHVIEKRSWKTLGELLRELGLGGPAAPATSSN